MDSLASKHDDQRAALVHRYGIDGLQSMGAAAGPWNEAIALMLGHRSVRGYKPDPVPPGTLETLMAAAMSAATSSNMQWCSVIAVSDPAKKKELAEIAGGQKHIVECPLYLCWVADLSRNERISEAEKTDFECMPWLETFMVACIDTALAAQNAVLAAESLGLGTVYIGAMRNDPVRVAKLLGLPPKAFVTFGLCIGYAADKGAGEVKPRLPQSTILHHDRYDAGREAQQRQVYDTEMSRFSQRHELQAATWTQRVLNRLGPIKSMNGRERMRAALTALGLEIR